MFVLTIFFCNFKGKTPEFINQDDQSRRWLNDFRTKPFAVPLSLEIIDRKFHVSWLETGFAYKLKTLESDLTHADYCCLGDDAI
jgi:hypothetical protein